MAIMSISLMEAGGHFVSGIDDIVICDPPCPLFSLLAWCAVQLDWKGTGRDSVRQLQSVSMQSQQWLLTAPVSQHSFHITALLGSLANCDRSSLPGGKCVLCEAFLFYLACTV